MFETETSATWVERLAAADVACAVVPRNMTLLDALESNPQVAATAFINPDMGVADAAAAVVGAGSILAERFAEDADLIGELRARMWSRGRLESRVRAGGPDARPPRSGRGLGWAARLQLNDPG